MPRNLITRLTHLASSRPGGLVRCIAVVAAVAAVVVVTAIVLGRQTPVSVDRLLALCHTHPKSTLHATVTGTILYGDTKHYYGSPAQAPLCDDAFRQCVSMVLPLRGARLHAILRSLPPPEGDSKVSMAGWTDCAAPLTGGDHGPLRAFNVISGHAAS